MSSRRKLLLGIGGVYLLAMIAVVVIFGAKRQDNPAFKPQNEFKLDNWVDLGPLLDQQGRPLPRIAAAILTVWTMVYVAKRMQERPNRVQTAVELLFTTDARQHHRAATWTTRWRRSGSRSSATLFLFIWFSNLIGYIPLPTNSEETFNLFGVAHPGLRDLRGDGERLDPARARARRVHRLQRRGRPGQGLRRLPQEPRPGGRRRARSAVSIFVLELVSNFMRLHLALRPTLRQHPRRPPDHPVHVRRPRRAARASRSSASSCCRSASSCSSSRSAWSPPFRRSSSPPSPPSTSAAPSPPSPLIQRSPRAHAAVHPSRLFAAAPTPAQKAGKAIALGVGGGLGAVGAGVGIGIIFGKVIESVTRQPEMRDEITSIQWLGFALTEACFFYGLVAGLIAFFL